MGLCRMLPYSRQPIGWFSTSQFAHFVRVEINEQHGRIEYRRCPTIHNTIDSDDMAHKVTTVLTLIKCIAGILAGKETGIDSFMQTMQNTRNNPQKSVKSTVFALHVQEGVFSMEENAIEALCIDNFGDDVLKHGWQDIKNKAAPYSKKGSR